MIFVKIQTFCNAPWDFCMIRAIFWVFAHGRYCLTMVTQSRNIPPRELSGATVNRDLQFWLWETHNWLFTISCNGCFFVWQSVVLRQYSQLVTKFQCINGRPHTIYEVNDDIVLWGKSLHIKFISFLESSISWPLLCFCVHNEFIPTIYVSLSE